MHCLLFSFSPMLRTNSQQLNLHRHIYLSCKAQRNPALQYNIDCEIYQYLPARRLTIKELQWATFTYGITHVRIWHFLKGGGVKNWPNLPMDNSKKLPTKGGRGQKSWKFADVFNGWSLLWKPNSSHDELVSYSLVWSKKVCFKANDAFLKKIYVNQLFSANTAMYKT